MSDCGVLRVPAAGGTVEFERRWKEHLEMLAADDRARMPLVVPMSQTLRWVRFDATVCICRPALEWVDGRMLPPLLNRDCERHGPGLEICDLIDGHLR